MDDFFKYIHLRIKVLSPRVRGRKNHADDEAEGHDADVDPGEDEEALLNPMIHIRLRFPKRKAVTRGLYLKNRKHQENEAGLLKCCVHKHCQKLQFESLVQEHPLGIIIYFFPDPVKRKNQNPKNISN